MIYRFNSIVIVIFLLSVNILYGQETENKMEAKPRQVEIPGTEVAHIYSAIVNQEFNLYINLPRGYDDKTKTFPVLFLLDAQWDFPLLNAIYGQQYYDGFVPGIVIVGITWGGKDPNPDQLRLRDFTPSLVQQSQPSGNAEKFLEFIKNELIPFIETRYRVSNDRALMGSSLGGLFTLYAMFNETTVFGKYILTSPALQWDNGILYNYEKSYSESNDELPARLYMAIGGYENVPMLEKFYNLLKERNYKNLSIGYNVIDGIGHSGSKADGYTRGLQFVFERPSLNLDNSLLEQYTGTYEISPGFSVDVKVENGHLIANVPFSGKQVLSAESETDFYMKGQYLFVHFKKDDSGKVTGFQLETYGGSQFVGKK